MKDSNTKSKTNETAPVVIPGKEIIVKDIQSLDKEVRNFKITDQPTRENASVILTAIKKHQKGIKEKKDSMVKPIKDSVKLIEAEFKKMESPLEELEQIIKAEIARDYRVQEEARIKAEIEARKKLEAERKKLEEQAKKAKGDSLTQELINNKIEQAEAVAQSKIDGAQEQKTVSTDFGKTNVRKIWKWELSDITKVPNQYMKTDDAKITAAVRSGVREIPGVRIYEDISVAGS